MRGTRLDGRNAGSSFVLLMCLRLCREAMPWRQLLRRRRRDHREADRRRKGEGERRELFVSHRIIEAYASDVVPTPRGLS